MKVRSRFLVDVPTGGSNMALAIEQLPVNVLTRNQTSMNLLVERAAAGDKSAFEQLMVNSQQRVLSVCWRMLGNEADARDATQEVFLRTYKYLGRFRQDQDFFAWVYGISLNVCRTFLKKRQRHTERFTSLVAEEGEGSLIPAADSVDGEEALLAQQRRRLMSQAIATLPYKERASILLREVEGLSTEEVARVLKSSSTTVRSQISSARRKIRDYCRDRVGAKS
jgi:RNA polymerase sigma-70 factor (ECF subfamily)